MLRAQVTSCIRRCRRAASRIALALAFGADDEPAFSDSQIFNAQAASLAGSISPAGSSSTRLTRTAKPLGNFLRSAKLDVSELDYLGLSFLDVTLESCRLTEGNWRIAVGGPNVVGTHRRAECRGRAPGNSNSSRLKFIDEVRYSERRRALTPSTPIRRKSATASRRSLSMPPR